MYVMFVDESGGTIEIASMDRVPGEGEVVRVKGDYVVTSKPPVNQQILVAGMTVWATTITLSPARAGSRSDVPSKQPNSVRGRQVVKG